MGLVLRTCYVLMCEPGEGIEENNNDLTSLYFFLLEAALPSSSSPCVTPADPHLSSHTAACRACALICACDRDCTISKDFWQAAVDSDASPLFHGPLPFLPWLPLTAQHSSPVDHDAVSENYSARALLLHPS